MSDPILTRTRIAGGTWEAVLTRSGRAEAPPRLEVSHLGEAVPGLEMHELSPGEWALRLPIPPALIADGVQTFVVRDLGAAAGIGGAQGEGAVLNTFTLVVGEPLAHDLRAEIDLLRAELDLLKRAFRRHCAES
ncbi:hypothetical protein [Wenxinia saemankumensis]|uniref:Uncharacterized protein n=1 Tax=Wenxinia saemankumensis TaxID=1447782 RepID=A0A1M6CB61_9RHOB|nr:hypothetical protein [Wenxinia saemankumensis]SHI58051.1 hypothetical protein SAMN05444417_1097 [Wenxinia saemankumensis]